MSEERKRPRIRRSSVNRDEERGGERMSYRSREGGEDGENRFERPFRRDDRRERRPPRDFGDRPRFSYIRDLNVEREKLNAALLPSLLISPTVHEGLGCTPL